MTSKKSIIGGIIDALRHDLSSEITDEERDRLAALPYNASGSLYTGEPLAGHVVRYSGDPRAAIPILARHFPGPNIAVGVGTEASGSPLDSLQYPLETTIPIAVITFAPLLGLADVTEVPEILDDLDDAVMLSLKFDARTGKRRFTHLGIKALTLQTGAREVGGFAGGQARITFFLATRGAP